MTKEHLPSPSQIEAHVQYLSGRLASVPELLPVINMATSEPTHVTDVFNSYLDLAGRLVNLHDSEYEAIAESQQRMSGEVGSASTVGANDLTTELAESNIDLSSVAFSSFDSSSPYYKPAVDELIERLEGGHAMKIAGTTPSDHDPDFLKVIWGHTVVTGVEALLHFVTMHYLERFMSKALKDHGVVAAEQKDFFINAMTDVIILNGLKNPDDHIFNLWVTSKDQGGLGWITEDRLKSFEV